jgi:hypothetical protein
MPAYPGPADDAYAATLQQLRRDIDALTSAGSFQFSDQNFAIRVVIGLLPDGDFGLLVSDALGNATEILPVYQNSVATNEGTSSTTYADLTTPGPLLTAMIGASGNALLTVNATIGIPGSVVNNTQSGGFVGVSIDGGAPAAPLDQVLYFANTSTGTALGQKANQSAQVVVTGLSVGQHTFEMKYEMDGPGTVNFGNRFLQVRPL